MAAADKGEFLIVTGMSGAGRTTAANALEDLGWYVVDNLPPQILPPLLDLTGMGGSSLPRSLPLSMSADAASSTISLVLPRRYAVAVR